MQPNYSGLGQVRIPHAATRVPRKKLDDCFSGYTLLPKDPLMSLHHTAQDLLRVTSGSYQKTPPLLSLLQGNSPSLTFSRVLYC